MDLFLAGNATTFGLYRNTTPNGLAWLQVRLVGTASNRAAIGAKVRVRAVIAGFPRWQLREVSAQNSFNGMSSLDAHFGLASATVADSVVVEWPSGNVSVVTGVSARQRIDIVEEMSTGVPDRAPGASFGLFSAWPNPGHGPMNLHFALAGPEEAVLELFDVAGRRLHRVTVPTPVAGLHVMNLAVLEHVGSGVYFVQLRQGPRRDALRIVVLR